MFLFEGPATTSVLRVVQRLEILSLTERRSILFSGTYLSGRKTAVGPVAGHAKNPILPFGLGLNLLLFFRQRFLKLLYIYELKGVHIATFEAHLFLSNVEHCCISNVHSYQCSCIQCCPIAVYAMCYSIINPWGYWT